MNSSRMYREWLSTENKDELRFYDSGEFRKDYTMQNMFGRTNLFKQRVLEDVRAVLRNTWSQTDSPLRKNQIRILSLGCGPGSDLLGLLAAVDSVLRSGDPQVGWKPGELQCHCTGVDAFDWDREVFRQRVSELCTGGAVGQISYRFFHKDMESFVYHRSRDNGLIGAEFDFICLSFADAGRNLELIGTALPLLLTECGRVLVLDNVTAAVRRLAGFGYACTFNRNGICLYSRGRSELCAAGYKFQPCPNSALRQYRRQSRIPPY